ncbi:MAG: translation initiation factor [Bacteroidetes bacterium]|jgi:translation initiation factor 1|nr:MAG: translation initiation factor [Bacteroidota bacterium]
MAGRKKLDIDGLVYSTNPDFTFDTEDTDDGLTPLPAKQDLRISLDRMKGNKMVTRIWNFRGREEDLEALGRRLKQFCGCGGSVKEMEILLQGDFREKIKAELTRLGYRYKQAGG